MLTLIALDTRGADAPALLDKLPAIVISEIQYRPLLEQLTQNFDPRKGGRQWKDAEDPRGEFVEIHNRSANDIDLSSWQLSIGIAFTFPDGTLLASGAYLAVCSDADALATNYGCEAVLGNFEGRLSNNGERIDLIDAQGQRVDTVRYGTTLPWPVGPDQKGQSLELLAVDSKNRGPENWRACSRQSSRTEAVTRIPTEGWIVGETIGSATTNQPNGTHPLYSYLESAGEWLLEDVRISEIGSDRNLIKNGKFNSARRGWKSVGNHRFSNVAESHAGNKDRFARVVAIGSGRSHRHSFMWPDVKGMTAGRDYKLSFRALHVRGAALTVYLSGDGLRVVIQPPLPEQNGETSEGSAFPERPVLRATPGARNSRTSKGVPPLARRWIQSPASPGSTHPVQVSVELASAEEIAAATLECEFYNPPYHSPDERLSLPMSTRGDGLYSATIQSQASQTLVRYRVKVNDKRGQSWVGPTPRSPIRTGRISCTTTKKKRRFVPPSSYCRSQVNGSFRKPSESTGRIASRPESRTTSTPLSSLMVWSTTTSAPVTDQRNLVESSPTSSNSTRASTSSA